MKRAANHAFEVASAITVRHVMTPISQTFGVDAEMQAGQAFAELRSKGFDNAPVTEEGRPVGLISSAIPDFVSSRPVTDYMRPLANGSFIAADASIGSLFQWLVESPCYLVLEGRDIGGLVTTSDLNKQPARTHLYVLLATVEMGLADALRRTYRDQHRILGLLPPARVDYVEDKLAADKEADIDADLVAVLELADLFTAVRKTDSINIRLAAASGGSLRTLAWKATTIRNRVMHPTRPELLLADLSIAALATSERRLRAMSVAIASLPKRLVANPRPAANWMGPTPELLARQLGVDPKALRGYLRNRHPRDPVQKGMRWGPLSKETVADVTAFFRSQKALPS